MVVHLDENSCSINASNNKSLPVFLVAYEDKSKTFSKRKVNSLNIEVLNWDNKHPEGQLVETIGYVSEIEAYCEYDVEIKT